jgi:hypothetical protein
MTGVGSDSVAWASAAWLMTDATATRPSAKQNDLGIIDDRPFLLIRQI